MAPIPRTFFLTGLGRSGTAFLAAALDRSPGFRVVHERRIPGTPFRDGRLRRFPLWRFYLARKPFGAWRPGYGEVNSHLRRALRPEAIGPEALIERRGVILRDPRDVIASGMNRNGRTEADFARLCEEKSRDFARLLGLLAHPSLHYERFEFRYFTTDPAYIQTIATWAGIGDLDLPPDLIARKVNTNQTDAFPRWDRWSDAHRLLFEEAAGRHGILDEVRAIETPSAE